MKRQAFLLLILPFIFTPKVFAQDVVTGNASAKNIVETSIEGGSVTTHIEVEANGEKKVFDSDKPGSYKVEVKSNGSGSTAQTSVGSSPSVTPQASPTAKVVKQNKETNKKNVSTGIFVMTFIKNIFDSFKNIFRF